MSRKQFKAAVRKRMAETGEPYSLARRMVLRDMQSGQPKMSMSDFTLPMNAMALEIGRAADRVAKAWAIVAIPDLAPVINARVQEISRAAEQATRAYARAAIPDLAPVINARVQEITRAAEQATRVQYAIERLRWI
jgi:hypothetical protein